MAFKKSCALEKRGVSAPGRDGQFVDGGSLMEFTLPFFEELNVGVLFSLHTSAHKRWNDDELVCCSFSFSF